MSCPSCERNQRMAKGALIDLENAETELRALRRRVKKLEADLEGKRKADPRMAEAADVFEYWTATQKRPERCLFTADRQRLLLARLHEGHTVPELKEAIDGAVVAAYERDGVRYDGIGTIFKGGESVRMHRAKAQANKADGSNLSPSELVRRIAKLAGEPAYSEAMGHYLFDCPVCNTEQALTMQVNGSLTMACAHCGAEEQRLRAFVATNGRART